MKKTKILVAAVAISLGICIHAKAALPFPAIIIGNNAYNVDYMVKHVEKFNDIINNLSYYDDIYYYDGSSIRSLFTGDTKLESDVHNSEGAGVDTLLYYDQDFNKNSYVFDKVSNSYKEDSPIANVNIVSTLALGYNVITITVSKVDSLPSALDPTYFQIVSQNAAYDFSDMIRKIGTPTSGENNDDYKISLTLPAGSPVKLNILSADKNVIATSSNNLNIGYSNTDPVPLITSNQHEVTPDKNGNAAGNVNNSGIAATDLVADDNWIYYSNLADGGSLYKKNLKGIEDYKISLDNAKYINVVGDWIYYSNFSDGQKIYKVRKDGTQRRIVCEDQASNLVVSGEYIYYINHKDVGLSNIGKIYKVKIDSISGTAATGQKVTEDEAEYINVVGDVIYYRNRSEKGALYSVHTDGSYRSKILSQNVRYVTVVGNYIYYISDEADLHRVALDGTGDTKIDVQRNESTSTLKAPKLSGFNIYNNTLYYWDNSDGNKMYRGTLPETSDAKQSVIGDKLVNTNLVDSVNIVKGNIYFTIGSKLAIANEPVLSGKDKTGNNLFTYSSTPVVAQKSTLKLLSYDKIAKPVKAIDGPIEHIEDYIPDKVTVVLSDGSVKEALVDWNLNPKVGSNGTKTYTGTLVDFGQKVTFVMDIYSEPLTDSNFAADAIINNAGAANDTIQVINLTDGDVITAYSDKNKTKILGTATAVNKGAKITLSGDNVFPDFPVSTDSTEGKVWLTRTSKGAVESNVVGRTIPPVGASAALDNNCPITIINYAERLDTHETSDDLIRIGAITGDPATGTNGGTDKLNSGDIIKIYRVNGTAKGDLIATQVVSDVTTNNGPFTAPTVTDKVDFTLSGSNILRCNESPIDSKIMITRTSVGKGESVPLTIDLANPTNNGGSIVVKQNVPLQYNIIATDISGFLNNGYASLVTPMPDMTSGYEYYYMLDGSDPGYTYGTGFSGASTATWTQITSPSISILLDPTISHTIRAVEVYNDSGTRKVIRYGTSQVQVVNDQVSLSQSTAVGKTLITGLKPNTKYYYSIDTASSAASVPTTTFATSSASGTIEIDAQIGQYVHVTNGDSSVALNSNYTVSTSHQVVAGDIAPDAAPTAVIDYSAEKISSGLETGTYECATNLNSTSWTTINDGDSISSYISNSVNTLYIRKKAAAGKPAGTVQALAIPARPAAPNAVYSSGVVSGLTANSNYEYIVDTTPGTPSTWTGATTGNADTSGKITLTLIPASGSYIHIRLKAATSSFASSVSDITVTP